jgi:hypothetical protein
MPVAESANSAIMQVNNTLDFMLFSFVRTSDNH